MEDGLEELEQLLAPHSWPVRAAKWRKLTTGTNLFDALQKSTAGPQPLDWQYYHELLEEFSEEYGDTAEYKRVQQLLWCAEQARQRAVAGQNEFDYASFTNFARLPPYIVTVQEREWAWGCIQTLSSTVQIKHSLAVPIALVNRSVKAGFLLSLQLEVLSPGSGVVFSHPADIFRYTVDETFTTAIGNAWFAARALVEHERPAPDLRVDGRWRLQPMVGGGVLPSPIEGNSAGGAAANGWSFALQQKVPDPYLIVLTAVEPVGTNDYQLIGVDGIAAKVEAIVSHGDYDTIMVADDVPLHGKHQGNFSEAVSSIHSLGRGGKVQRKVRVKRIDTGETWSIG
jgi:hypothetical protein